MTMNTRIVFVLFTVFMASACKSIDQQECPAVKQEPVVLNPTGNVSSGIISCEGESSKILRIQRVFMHLPQSFSFMVEVEEGKRSILLILSNAIYPEFIWDVPRGEAAYAICKSGESKLELHLYSKDQVEGSGWNQGKSGSGQTVVVPMQYAPSANKLREDPAGGW